jgi:hypothetical protein
MLSVRSQKNCETGLLKMSIGGQRVGYVALAHDLKRNAVGEGPRFIPSREI